MCTYTRVQESTHITTVCSPSLPEGMQDWEADSLKHLVRSSEVVQKHDEEAMVSKLVEITMSVLMVLNKHM